MQRSWLVYTALVVFALVSVGQAQASLNFTFGSSAVSFNANGSTVVCGASPQNYINMNCSWGGAGDLALPSTNQTLTLSASTLYYYLGSMYPNEGNGKLTGSNETGSRDFRIDFTANYTPSGSNNFQIVVPVTGVAGGSNFGSLTFGSGSQTFNLAAQPGYTLTGRILWDGVGSTGGGSYTNSSSEHLPSNPGDLDTQWQWITNGPGNVGYMYLEMTYDTNTLEPATNTPEPATFVLLGSALVGLGLIGRRRRKA